MKPVGLSRVFPYAGEYEERTHEAGLDRWYRVDLPKNISLRDAEAAFYGKPGIEKVEFRRQIVGMFDNTVIPAGEYIPATNSAATKVFNDPRLSQQWHYYNDGAQKGMTAGCDVNVLPIWKDKVAGNSNVIVSVVDGGIQYDHPDPPPICGQIQRLAAVGTTLSTIPAKSQLTIMVPTLREPLPL